MPLTKQEINDMMLDPPNAEMVQPVIPTWSVRVNGRKFGQFMHIARQKPRRSILFLPIIDPYSMFATIWGTIAIFNDFTYTAFVVALSLAFNDYTTSNAYWYLDFIGSAIYILDVFIEFHVGFVVHWDSSSVTITDGIRVAKHYMRNGTFWIDVLACLPIIGQIVISSTSSEALNSSAVRMILLLKLLRLGRVIRLIARVNKFEQGGVIHQWISQRVNSVTMFACNTFFSLMVIINLLACLWWWIAVTEGLDNSWVAAVAISKPDIDLENGSNATRWIVCAYYSLVTMATIGYGDIVPVTTGEIGLVIGFIFCGVAFFGYVLSTLKGLMESSATEDSLSNGDYTKFQEMESWMKRFSFPKGLQREIRGHCYTVANSSNLTAVHDADFYESLPLWLKVKVAVELQKTGLIALVGGEDVWASIPEDTKSAISKVVALMSQPELLHSNIKVHNVGEKCENVLFLEEGQLSLFVPGVAHVITISSPAILGAGSLFASWSEVCGTWKAAGRTSTRCCIWKVNSEILAKRLMEIAPEVLQLIAVHYLDELKKTRSELERLRGNAQSPGILALIQFYDARIEGAQLAYEDLETKVRMAQEAERAAAAAADASRPTTEMNTLHKLAAEQGMDLTEPGEPPVAGEVQVSDGVAARLLELELQNNLVTDIDLEQNGLDLQESLGNKLDRRQQSMYMEDLEGKQSGAVAAGVLRKEGNTTFVV